MRPEKYSTRCEHASIFGDLSQLILLQKVVLFGGFSASPILIQRVEEIIQKFLHTRGQSLDVVRTSRL